MTENGWVCENYEEFRQFFWVDRWDNMTNTQNYYGADKDTITVSELRERNYRKVWEDLYNKVIQVDDAFAPCLDIRFLKYLAWYVENNDFLPQNYHLSNIHLGCMGGGTKLEMKKLTTSYSYQRLIKEIPDAILKLLSELYECYDKDERYGKIVVAEGYEYNHKYSL